jgi:hypothetical protein
VANAPELNRVLQEIYYDMQHRITTADPQGRKLTPDSTAKVTITQVQPNLKQVTLSVNYTDETGTPLTFTKTKFIHKDAEH